MTPIPMNQIRPEVRDIAVSFADVYIDLRDTVKLASDIQNYADSQVAEYRKKVFELLNNEYENTRSLSVELAIVDLKTKLITI